MFDKEQIKILKELLSQMGFGNDDIKSEMRYLKKHLENLPEEIILYRIISVDNKEDINTKLPGSHYSHSKKDLISSHNFTTGYGEKKFLITVKAKRNQIDFFSTLENNILYPNEQEITLKNKGKGVEITSIREIK
jgi:hypothetical protein